MAKWTEQQKQAAKDRYAEKSNKTIAETVQESLLTKVETFNGETVPEHVEKEGSIGFRMSLEEKVQSMINTAKILPPNMIKEGRHLKVNIQALNCFHITDEMMDLLYKDFKHEPF